MATVVLMTASSDTGSLLAHSALQFIDENGLDALTLRALGQAAGMHHTAVYRHHRNKDDVLRAVLGLVIAEAMDAVGTPPDDPRERIMVLALALRAALHEHPGVAAAYLTASESVADSDSANQFQAVIVESLTALGLSGHDLLVRHQALESYVLGATVFDFAGAPDHLETRRRRHRSIGEPAFEEVTRSADGVDALNEAAFRHGLTVLVEECVTAGRANRGH